MWLLASALELGLPTGLGFVALAGLVYVALRFQRADAGESVTQMDLVVRAALETLDRCRAERTELEDRLRDKRAQIKDLEAEVRRLRRER